MQSKAHYHKTTTLQQAICAARDGSADLVIKNAQFLDVFTGQFRAGDVAVQAGNIVGTVEEYTGKQVVDGQGLFVVPGFIDAHVHIESSLMTPARFQQAVLPCGTTAVIWDPHEIANVQGVEGIRWALDASEGLDLDVFVMVPSCVPSTTPVLELESSGAELKAQDILEFRHHPRVLGLAEMMNFPGLLHGDEDVMNKLVSYGGMQRDGHCPGLLGRELNAYGVAGIHSCHESTSLEEAQEKLSKGIHVLIREGSCAKNAADLLPLLNAYTSSVLCLCSDDRNPADIVAQGHINCILNLALAAGHRPEEVFRIASFAPAQIYGLHDRGVIAPGYQADLCLLELNQQGNWQAGFHIHQVIKAGKIITAEALETVAQHRTCQQTGHRNMNMAPVQPAQLHIAAHEQQVTVQVIEVIPNQIITQKKKAILTTQDGNVQPDLEQAIIKIGVFERHHGTGRSSIGFVHGFGLKAGAVATSVNHDSHNIIVVGANDAAILQAMQRLRELDGGIVVCDDKGTFTELALEVGGLMSHRHPDDIAQAIHQLKQHAKRLGCNLHEPFLQLSFLALPVIPALKITDQGLVDVERFCLTSVLC
ncbi:MAG: adenine deaminase [Candidatus Electrothrix sp. AUS3]|nr:adenine deaminase [Candidatus Electrothrix gigas]